MRRLVWALVACFATLFLYQALLYRRIPVAPGDPYGLGDVLELAGYLFAFGAAAAAIVIASIAALLKKTTPRRAAMVWTVAAVLVLVSRVVDFRYWTVRF